MFSAKMPHGPLETTKSDYLTRHGLSFFQSRHENRWFLSVTHASDNTVYGGSVLLWRDFSAHMRHETAPNRPIPGGPPTLLWKYILGIRFVKQELSRFTLLDGVGELSTQ
jgi:hypothetical protein